MADHCKFCRAAAILCDFPLRLLNTDANANTCRTIALAGRSWAVC